MSEEGVGAVEAVAPVLLQQQRVRYEVESEVVTLRPQGLVLQRGAFIAYVCAQILE